MAITCLLNRARLKEVNCFLVNGSCSAFDNPSKGESFCSSALKVRDCLSGN